MDEAENSNKDVNVNEAELRIAALNVDGILFQQRVKSKLEQAGLEFHAAEFGVSTAKSKSGLYRESQLDLWFRWVHDGCIFEILIECKKADPNLKEWIFFKADQFRTVHYCEFVFRSNHSTWEKARINIPSKSFQAFAGRELKGEWSKTKGITDPKKAERIAWKTSSDRIDKACDQIAIAARSIGFLLRDNKDPFPTSGGQPHFIIPVVITNASLFKCDLKSEFHESANDGVSADHVIFNKIHSLVLQYALSTHLQPSLQTFQEEMSKTYISGMGFHDILICNLPNAAEEIVKLCKAAAKEISNRKK